MARLLLTLPDPMLRAVRLQALRSGVSAPALCVGLIEASLLAGGAARTIRLALEADGTIIVEDGGGVEVDLSIAEALERASSQRGQVAEVAAVLEECPAVVEVFGTIPELRRRIRLAMG